jgi:hypothetical protein
MKLVTKGRASHLITLAAGLVLGFTAVGTAAAVSASPAAKTVTHHYSLAASAFAPDGLHDVTKDYFNSWDPTALSNQDSGRCFNAGLSLPPNSVLKSITFYFTKGASVMFSEINRQNLTNHTAKELASFDSTTTTGTPFYTHKTLSIPKAESQVNMTDFAYSIGACPSGTTTFSGITITYTASS